MSRFARGNTKSAKLTNEEVFRMRTLYATGEWTQGALAREFKVAINTVGGIVRGETRHSVPMALDPEEIAASERRLAALQERVGQEVLEKTLTQAQKVYDKTVKPERDLNRFVDVDRAKTFGAFEGEEDES